MWTAAKRAMTSNVGCGSFTANGTWGGCLGGLGAGRGFFGDFFFHQKGNEDTPVSKEKQYGMKKDMKVADGSLYLRMPFFKSFLCVMMSNWTSLAHC